MSKKSENQEEQLNCDSIEIVSINRDWSQGYGESWEYLEATDCYKCGAPVVGSNGAECPKCGAEQDSMEGPMMSYYYPLPSFEDHLKYSEPPKTLEAAALVLKDLPLCLVHFTGEEELGEEWALALTGGGMNLSWEICEAFILLGYYPPLRFCHLPEMAGKTLNKENRRILAACKESARIAGNWAAGSLRDLKALEARMPKRRK